MLLHPVLLLDTWQIVLYIAIILVALFSLIALVLIGVLVLEVIGLVRQVRQEATVLIDQAQQTVKTVQGTSEFVTSGLVKPLIASVSVSAGVAKTVQVLSGSLARSLRRNAKDEQGSGG